MNSFKIVETDNFGGDYPNETALKLPRMSEAQARTIAYAINEVHCDDVYPPRFWKVVPQGYELQPGFEP